MQTKRKAVTDQRNKPTIARPRQPKLIVPQTRNNSAIIPDDGTRVCVCCRFPQGVKLRIFELVDVTEHGPPGSRTVQMAQQIGGPDNFILVKGYNKSEEHFVGGLVHSGYAVTKNVPTAFWKLWLSQNADSDLVLNHLIWAHPQEASVRSFIREHESQLCGLEPLQPTPPASPYGPPPQPVDPRMKGLRFAPTTAAKD